MGYTEQERKIIEDHINNSKEKYISCAVAWVATAVGIYVTGSAWCLVTMLLPTLCDNGK